MNQSIKRTVAGLIGLSLLSAASAGANQFNIGDVITVAEASINPNQTVQVTIVSPTLNYSGGVYAGINQLIINGSVTVNGFCIDPFHYSSSSPLTYTVVNLASAPKGDPNTGSTGMGATAALYIERLWGTYYSPSMSASAAAGLQIAIWELVGQGTFSLQTGQSDYGAAGFLKTVEAANYSGPVATLVGLTGPGQDYVVQNVADGGTTAVLMGLGLAGIAAARRKLYTY